MTQSTTTPTIIVYSRSGASRRAAGRLGQEFGVTPFEVTTSRYRWPGLGWLAAGRDGLRGRSAPLDQTLVLPHEGLVILVGPVWAGGPAAPLNTVIDALRGGAQSVAALLTCGDAKEDVGPAQRMAERLGRPVHQVMVLSNAAESRPEGAVRIAEFARDLQALAA